MAAHQAPLSLGFSRREYWSWLAFPSPMHACMLSCFSHVRLCVTLWTVAHHAPLSTGFSRQEYWSGLPFPSPVRVKKHENTDFITSPVHRPSTVVCCLNNKNSPSLPNLDLGTWIFQNNVCMLLPSCLPSLLFLFVSLPIRILRSLQGTGMCHFLIILVCP